MADGCELIIEYTLKPGDVYSPFRWDRYNLARWVTAALLCYIFYDVYNRMQMDLIFESLRDAESFRFLSREGWRDVHSETMLRLAAGHCVVASTYPREF